MRAWLGCLALLVAVRASAAAQVQPPPAPSADSVSVCVVAGGALRWVRDVYRPGNEAGEQRPPPAGVAVDSAYGATRAWYANRENISLDGRSYWAVGLPFVKQPGELVPRGEYEGVTVFAEAGAQARPVVVYVPLAYSCEFQRYETEAGQSVRGG